MIAEVGIAGVVSFSVGLLFHHWLTRDGKLRRENRILRTRVSRLEKWIADSDDDLSAANEMNRLYESHFGDLGDGDA